MTIEEDTDAVIDPVLRAFRARLATTIAGHVYQGYVRGWTELTQYAGMPYEGPPTAQAVQWAERHAAQLVTEMEVTTKERLAKVISDGIRDKEGIPKLTSIIRQEFGDMAQKRARTIARTETNDALSEGSMSRMKDLRVTGKQVITGDPCEICQAFEAEGAVPIDHEYVYEGQSYGRQPAFHPNCVCVAAPVMLERG